MRKLLYLLLGALGFAGCSESFSCEYGTPSVDFTVKGKVTDSEGTPIKGIVVSLETDSGTVMQSTTTATDGTFTTTKTDDWLFYDSVLIFTDTDGEANGGDFATYEVEVEELPKTKVKEGDGNWYQGEYEVTVDVKLRKK
ncbi:MAG: radical SAM-associated putative lipoprotein [Alistipes sp.]|nr:radical SAM-associated putative lipoprotein [Alistipes sp.]